MTKSYCVQERKQTDCVPGSEVYTMTKNGRNIMKCKCASCGITKTKFVRRQRGGIFPVYDKRTRDWMARTGVVS